MIAKVPASTKRPDSTRTASAKATTVAYKQARAAKRFIAGGAR